MDNLEDIYKFTKKIQQEVKNEEIKKRAILMLLNYQRFKNHKYQRDALEEATMLCDDLKILLKLEVELDNFEYEFYQKYKGQLSKFIKNLIIEKSIAFTRSDSKSGDFKSRGDRDVSRSREDSNSRGDFRSRDRDQSRYFKSRDRDKFRSDRGNSRSKDFKSRENFKSRKDKDFSQKKAG